MGRRGGTPAAARRGFLKEEDLRGARDNVDWVQYYGYTESGPDLYPTNNGRHTGLDWGRAPQDLGGSWNYDIDDWEFDGTYGTPERPLIPVYSPCDCTLVKDVGDGYAPGRVDLVSNNPEHSDLMAVIGHLQDIPFARDPETGNFLEAVELPPGTLIGYLDTSQFHAHVELRRSDGAYINPFPYFSPELQAQMLTFQGDSPQTRYRGGYPNNPYYQLPGFYP